jgi:hypothetical protein
MLSRTAPFGDRSSMERFQLLPKIAYTLSKNSLRTLELGA